MPSSRPTRAAKNKGAEKISATTKDLARSNNIYDGDNPFISYSPCGWRNKKNCAAANKKPPPRKATNKKCAPETPSPLGPHHDDESITPQEPWDSPESLQTALVHFNDENTPPTVLASRKLREEREEHEATKESLQKKEKELEDITVRWISARRQVEQLKGKNNRIEEKAKKDRQKKENEIEELKVSLDVAHEKDKQRKEENEKIKATAKEAKEALAHWEEKHREDRVEIGNLKEEVKKKEEALQDCQKAKDHELSDLNVQHQAEKGKLNKRLKAAKGSKHEVLEEKTKLSQHLTEAEKKLKEAQDMCQENKKSVSEVATELVSFLHKIESMTNAEKHSHSWAIKVCYSELLKLVEAHGGGREVRFKSLLKEKKD